MMTSFPPNENSSIAALLLVDPWLDTNEAAVYLRTSPKQIRSWVYQGKIRAYKLLGRSYRFRRQDLDSLLKGVGLWE